MAEQDRGLGLAAVVIAAFAALGIVGPSLKSSPLATSPPSTNKSITSNRSAHSTRHYEHSAADLLEDFFDEDPDQVADRPWTRHPVKAETRPADDYKIFYLIATLPKPDTSRLRYQFDDYQNAIEIAANAAGFTLDSFDLPWLRDSQSDSKDEDLTIVPVHGSRRSEIKVSPDESSKKSTHEDPGVILLRGAKDPEKNSLLVVLMVGESPTDGINKIAFRNALDQVTWLSGWSVYPPLKHEAPFDLRARVIPTNPVVWILGPTFSGSATSIKETLTAWLATFRKEPPRVKIISLAVAIGHTLDDKEHGEQVLRTQIPEDQTFPYVLDSLLLGPANFTQVQNHSQSSTATPTPSRLDPIRSRRSTSIAILHEESTLGSSYSNPDENSPPVTYLPFPVHISDVRTAMEKVDTTQASRGPDVSHHDAPVAEDEDNRNEKEWDVIPSFSKRSAAYDERILYNLLSTIHQEHFTYIGIVATDVEDLVFLAHEIRLTCPDTILFTTPSTNIRYLNSDANPDLEGMLVFSTYPLFPMSQSWTSPFDLSSQIQFQSNASEAEYNGMLAYLAQVHQPEHAVAPSSDKDNLETTAKMLDYATPFETPEDKAETIPVLWVSVVGRDAIWPLAFHKFDDQDGEPLLKHRLSSVESRQAWDAKPTLSSSFLWLGIWTSLPFMFVYFAASTGWIRQRMAWIIVVALICGLAIVAWSVWPGEPGFWTIALLRASTLSNGVSPLHPVLFLTFAVIAMISGKGRSKALLDEHPLCKSFLGLEPCASFERIETLVDEVVQRLTSSAVRLPLFRLWSGVFVAGCLLFGVRYWHLIGFSIDGFWFELLILFAAIVALALLLSMMLRAVCVWRYFSILLQQLYSHPTRAYYAIARERMLPGDSGHRNPVKLFESRVGYSAVEYCLECARRLVWLGNKYRGPGILGNDNTIVDRIISQRDSLSFAVEKVEQKISGSLPQEVQKAMAELAKQIGDIYGPYWRLKPRPGTYLIGENSSQFNGDGEAIPAERKAGVIELGGMFVAARITDLIQHILSHLMNAALFTTFAAVALVLSVSEYPFPYRDRLLVISWVILLAVAATIMIVGVEISRNGVLSLLSGTTPGRFNLDSTFLWTVITFGILPLLTILGAQFPHFFRQLFSWIGSAGGGH